MRRFILKLALFLLPFYMALAIELLILPIDYFTFRTWEALVVKKFKRFLKGPFYPNMELTKIEEGDLAHHTKFAKKKIVKWVTDRYGYRKKDSNEFLHIVIVGDSNIAGSGLTQDEMLSEILEKELKLKVYPLAPEGMETFFKTRRFIEHPPKILVFARVERDIPYLSPIKSKRRYQIDGNIRQIIEVLLNNKFLQSTFVFLDQLSKFNMLHYLRASIRRKILPDPEVNPRYKIERYGQIFFLKGPDANREVSKGILDNTVSLVKSYHDALTRKGIRFIFLPIPEKENILHELLQTPKPKFLGKLIARLRTEGIDVLDTQKAFEEAYKKRHILPYQIDDTHWNVEGVKIAAQLIKEALIRPQ